jgi:hypothetical protein
MGIILSLIVSYLNGRMASGEWQLEGTEKIAAIYSLFATRYSPLLLISMPPQISALKR